MPALSRVAAVGLQSLLLAVCASGALACDPERDVFVDATSELSTDNAYVLNVFKDVHFAPGTACAFSVAPDPKLTILDDKRAVVDAWRSHGWSVVTWHWHYTTEQVKSADLPTLCSGYTHLASNNGVDSISSVFQGQISQQLVLEPRSFVMRLNSMPYFEKSFGARLYPRTGAASWPIMYLGRKFRFRKLSDYSNLTLSLRARLLDAVIHTGDAPAPDAHTGEASPRYNPRVNGTRMLISVPLRWHPQSCVSQPDTPACKAFFNKPVNVEMFFFDERFQYWSGPHITGDPGTAGFGGISLYRASPRSLIPGQPAENPFEKPNVDAIADGDILPLLKSAILEALKTSEANGDGKMPPRLDVEGRREGDDDYLAHFAISDFAVGYESSGLADISYRIEKLVLSGLKKKC